MSTDPSVAEYVEEVSDVEISDFENQSDDEEQVVIPTPAATGKPLTAEDVLNKIESLLLQSKIDARNERMDTTSRDRRHSKKNTSQEEEEEIAHMNHEDFTTGPITTQPSNFKGEMRDYQLEALTWMMSLHDSGLNGILADEMGLGKTCETISLLAYLRCERGINGQHIIIVPKSTITNWQREINRFCPDFEVLVFAGTRQEREEKRALLKSVDIILTTYEVVIIERSVLRYIKFSYLIIDEAHRIKNEQSKLSKVVRQLRTKHRLLITGTPLQNNLHELWALLNFLKPSIFKTASDFQLLFQLDKAGSLDPTLNTEGLSPEEYNAKMQDVVIKRLHRILRPFLLRRLKTDVATALPPKVETKLFVGLSAMQREWYTNLLARDVDSLNSNATQGTKTQLLNMMMQLRKVCNHVYLFDGAEPEPFVDGEHLIENSGKMVLLDKLLKKLQSQGSRVLIFSQMTRMLDILEDYCRYRQYQYCRIDGSTPQAVRDEQMDSYNAPNSEKFVFLLSTRAGGLGINLQTADTVIIFDSDWNPQMDLQAMDRAHRIGQKKVVNVFRFVTEGTVEEKIIERATRKLALDALVVQKGRLLEKEKNVSAQELQNMVRFGANFIFSAQGSTITDDDIDVILSKGKERTAQESEKLQTAKLSLSSFSLTDLDAHFNTNEFDGVDYSNTKLKIEVPVHVQASKRDRKTEGSYDVDKYYKTAIYGSNDRKYNMREFKPTPRYDYQFLNEKRIAEIEEMIFNAETRYRMLKCESRLANLQNKNLKPLDMRFEKRKIAKAFSLICIEGKERAEEIEKEIQAEEAAEEERRNAAASGTAMTDDTNAEETKDSTSTTKDTKDTTSTSKEAGGSGEEEGNVDTDAMLRKQAEFPSEEIYQELDTLLKEGYAHWRKLDLQRFINACATYGRNNIEEIQYAVEGKTPEEVRVYHQVFWERLTELKDYDKYLKTVERGEAQLRKLKSIETMILSKIGTVRDPLLNLPINISHSSKAANIHHYSDDEDRFILCAMAHHGYGNWEEIRKDIIFNPYFRCNLFMKTRSVADIKARAEMLVRMLEKEKELGVLPIVKDEEEEKKGKRKLKEDTKTTEKDSRKKKKVKEEPTEEKAQEATTA